jgi:hypothetical protein
LQTQPNEWPFPNRLLPHFYSLWYADGNMPLLVCEEHFRHHTCDIVANEHNSNTSLMPKNIKLQKPIMSYNLEFFVNCLGLQNAVANCKTLGALQDDYSMSFFCLQRFHYSLSG